MNQIKECVVGAIDQSPRHRVRPYEVVRSVARDLGLDAEAIRKALDELVRDGKLVYTYRDPCSYLERRAEAFRTV